MKLFVSAIPLLVPKSILRCVDRTNLSSRVVSFTANGSPVLQASLYLKFRNRPYCPRKKTETETSLTLSPPVRFISS